MKRQLVLALCLLAPQAGAAHSKVPFVLRHLKESNLVVLAPMLPVEFVASEEEGVRELTGSSEVLQCKVGRREQKVVVDGAEGNLVLTVLDCGDRRFIIRGVSFEAVGK